ncbi:MAG: PDZ domain-containing protein [Clostridia bacterium]|nr:PDZ domain-containing protein [Clostridia bacterium]
MNFKLKKLISLILSVIFVFSSAVCTIAQEGSTQAQNTPAITGDEAAAYINEAVAIIMTRYKFDVNKADLYKAALTEIIKNNPELLDSAFKGMFDGLDDYSFYFTKEELDSFMGAMSAEVCGIGVLVTASDSGLIISRVYDNSPAKEAGLIQGDIITHASGVYLGGLDIDLAKQNVIGEENTPVTIIYSRNGVSTEVTLIRRKVAIDAGFYQIVEDGKIGYISLNEFNANACEFVEKALKEFDSKNIKDIIFDLRGNPGGGLNEFVDVASLFIPSGPAIHLEYKNPLRFTTLYAENKDEIPKYNLAVLINNASASASEAFSAAIQDTGVGIVIGETSFGKGTMQNLLPFKIGGGIKITEAEYLSPNGRKVNKIGVTPDVKAPDKISEYERADIEPMTYSRILKQGDTGKDVLAIEERLRLVGLFNFVPDEVFDYDTYIATLNFQKSSELYPYGVMDYTTQAKLDGMLKGIEVRSDTSYKKAVEIFKEGNWQDYKKDWSVTE